MEALVMWWMSLFCDIDAVLDYINGPESVDMPPPGMPD